MICCDTGEEKSVDEITKQRIYDLRARIAKFERIIDYDLEFSPHHAHFKLKRDIDILEDSIYVNNIVRIWADLPEIE